MNLQNTKSVLIIGFLMVSSAFCQKTSNPQRSSISGYIQVQYKYDFQDGPVPNNEFQIRRGRINFRSTIINNVLGIIEIDCGRGELTVKDIGVECQVRRFLNFFIGQHKMPFSREQLCSARRLLVIERSEMNDLFDDYGYLGRDIGISVSGEIAKAGSPIGYALGIFNGNGYKVAGDNDNAKQFAERITVGPVGNILIGINSTQRSDSITHDAMIAYGADLSFQKWGITVEAEVLSGNTGLDETMFGGYIVALYRIGNLEPAVKIERLYPDSDATADFIQTYTFNLGWYFHKRMRLQTDLITNIDPGQQPHRRLVMQLQVEF